MKKLLLFALVLSCFLCAFALTASAEVLEWTETQDLGFSPKTTTDGTVTFDTTSRVMLKHTVTDPDTQETTTIYTTYPAYYILKCTDTVFSSKRSELDFTALKSATGISYDYSSVYKLEIPVGFTSMEDRNFRVTDGIDKTVYVKIPEGVTAIGDFSFYQNTSIEEIILPDSLTEFSSTKAFQNCTALESVRYSNNLTTIEESCFDGCSSLSSFTGGDRLVTLGLRAFKNCSSLKSITLPETLTTLVQFAFYQAGLTSVDIPASVTSIGSQAFENCKSLESVRIRCSVIGYRMFYNCTKLSSISMSNITSMGNGAFYQSMLKLNGSGSGVLFYAGDNYQDLVNFASTTTDNGYFSSATPCTYDEYVAYKTNGTVPEGKTFSGKCLLVYNCPYCETLYDGHDFTEEIVPTFVGDKFVSTCSLGQLCTREQCGKQVPVSTLDPLFSFRGFSASSYNGSIMQSFAVTRDLIDEYEELFGKISFGLLAAVEKVDSTDESTAGKFEGSLYDKENGKFLNKVATVDFSDKDFDIFEMKVTGLTAFPNIQLYCCAYLIVDGNILYLHNQSSSDSAIFFTPSLV